MTEYSVYEIEYSYHQRLGDWHAQDDFRPGGVSSSRHSEKRLIVAKSEGAAVSWLKEKHRYWPKDHKLEYSKPKCLGQAKLLIEM